MQKLALIVVSATPGASALRHSPAALEARSLRGLRRDAEGSHVAETVRAVHTLPLGFGMGRSDGRIHTRDRFYIGGVAHACIGVSAHTLHEHGEYLTVADAVIETPKLVSQDALPITVVCN
jgi:hypothetical protein